MSMSYHVIFFRDRCMGFHTDAGRAKEIAELLGFGSDVERVDGLFPTDEAEAAAEHNARRAKAQKVRTLRAVPAVVDPLAETMELDADELSTLVSSLGLEELGLPEDPWAEEEPTQTHVTCLVEPGQSGFFASKAG